MRVTVHSAEGAISGAVRESVVRRVLLGLSRFGPLVRLVAVHLSSQDNPMGGIDFRCQLRARLQRGADVHAEAIDGGSDAVVARSVAQLATRVHASLDDLKQ